MKKYSEHVDELKNYINNRNKQLLRDREVKHTENLLKRYGVSSIKDLPETVKNQFIK